MTTVMEKRIRDVLPEAQSREDAKKLLDSLRDETPARFAAYVAILAAGVCGYAIQEGIPRPVLALICRALILTEDGRNANKTVGEVAAECNQFCRDEFPKLIAQLEQESSRVQ